MEYVFEGIYDGFRTLVEEIQRKGKVSDSRLGKALKFPYPVLLRFTNPRKRVLLSKSRCGNPFFHLAEVFWILSGSNSLNPPKIFNSGYSRYSDDGVTLNGAYGHRLRQNFGFDQIYRAIWELSNDPNTRRITLQLWDAKDLGKKSNDIPCHTQIYLWIEDNLLNMTVCNRSNDLVWGLFGSNFVHFTMLMEFITSALKLRYPELELGYYHVFSNNLHCYVNEENPVAKWAPDRWLGDIEPCTEDKPFIQNHYVFERLSKLLTKVMDNYANGIKLLGFGVLDEFKDFVESYKEEPFIRYCALNFASYLGRSKDKKATIFSGWDNWDRAMEIWYSVKGYDYEVTSQF